MRDGNHAHGCLFVWFLTCAVCTIGIAKKASESLKESTIIALSFILWHGSFGNVHLIICPSCKLYYFASCILFDGSSPDGLFVEVLTSWSLNFGSGALLLVGAKAVYPCPERFTPPGGPTVSPALKAISGKLNVFFQACFC